MSTVDANRPLTKTTEQQLATFYIGEFLLAIDISLVQEINRHLDTTSVPHAPAAVQGVINLRGDVATVVDLRTVLGLPKSDDTTDTRNLIIRSEGELIGLRVDRIADILTVQSNEISPTPSNIGGLEGRFFQGVHALESEIVVILNLQETLDF